MARFRYAGPVRRARKGSLYPNSAESEMVDPEIQNTKEPLSTLNNARIDPLKEPLIVPLQTPLGPLKDPLKEPWIPTAESLNSSPNTHYGIRGLGALGFRV